MRGTGHIINNSSQAGLMANPGTGYYSTTKFAVEALTEALAKEMAPFGVKVSAIQPGAFRTDWAGRSMKRTQTPLPAYAESVGKRAEMISEMSGNQPGDPKRAAEAVVMLVRAEHPPVQLLLGRGVLASYRAKLAAVSASIDEWENVTVGTDFPDS
jgi:NAD(P)-dependent dehydrogenase (short-subunit alcohol dehydrogenase family)